jgi:hypothetical protein
MVVVSQEKGHNNLQRLQNDGFKLLTMDQIVESRLSQTHKDIAVYVARKNSFMKIPTRKEIIKEFDLTSAARQIYCLEDKEIIFSVTIPDIRGFFGLPLLSSQMPERFKWMARYLGKYNGKKFSRLSCKERVNRPRSTSFERHYIANIIGEDGKPYYYPLGLHEKNK